MQKFEFTLERSLKIRRQQERYAEIEVLRASAAVDAARARLEQFEVQLQEHATMMHRAVGQQLPPGEWGNMNLTTMLINESIVAAKGDLMVAEQRLDDARQRRATIASEAEALQSIRDQQFDQFKKQLQKLEQERVDESGLRTWLANASESE